MKFVVFFIVCVAVVHGELSQAFKDKVIEEVMKVGEKCAGITKATEDDIKEIMQRQTPSKKEGKCLLYCFNKEFGAQGIDGKFTVEGIEKAMAPYKKEDEALYNKFMKLMTDICLAKVTATDPCEAATEMDICYRENADEDIRNADAFF